MTAILDALRTALLSYKDELEVNVREEAQSVDYLKTLRVRQAHLRSQIAEIEETLATQEGAPRA